VFFQQKKGGNRLEVEDNPYLVSLAPDELHELLSEYETYVEWSHKVMETGQRAVAERVIHKLRQADATHLCLDETDQPQHAQQSKQFSRDDVVRMMITTLNTVLGKLHLSQNVEGMAMLPAGKGLYLIDVVIKNVAAESTWGVSITIQGAEAVADGPTEMNKEFPITNITKADLVSAGFSSAVVADLTDSDMQHIASAMEDLYCDSGFWEDLQICTRRTLEHREEQAVLEQDEQTSGDEDGLT
jgi:hypothetical protein